MLDLSKGFDARGPAGLAMTSLSSPGLDRVTHYSRDGSDKSRSHRVLGRPVKPGDDSGGWPSSGPELRQVDRMPERLLHQIEGIDQDADADQLVGLEPREIGDAQADRLVGVQR